MRIELREAERGRLKMAMFHFPADLLGRKGRAWLLAQSLPPDESDCASHLREYDRLTEDLSVLEWSALTYGL